MFRHTGCATQVGYFSTKNPKTWVPFWSKKSLKKGPISQNLPKNWNISHFWGRKTFRNEPWFAKIMKNCLISHFWVRKILRYGCGFQTSGRTLRQKIIQVPPTEWLLLKSPNIYLCFVKPQGRTWCCAFFICILPCHYKHKIKLFFFFFFLLWESDVKFHSCFSFFLWQNIPHTTLVSICEALGSNTTLKSLSMASTRSNDAIAKVRQ